MRNILKFVGRLSVLFVCALSLSSIQIMADDNSEKGASSLEEKTPNSYPQHWLDQDVAYIITDEERAAFKRLTTNEEYHQFIRQFWFRRDPTTETLENRFRAEHYRRMAYANGKYTKDLPGWRTDQGKIYILLGPPDEISIAEYPSEIWHYYGVPGFSPNKEVVLEFTDRSRSGIYRLTMDPSVEALLNWFRKEIPPQEPCVQSYAGLRRNGVSRRPLVRYKDLEAVLNTKLTYSLLTFQHQTAFMKVTDATVLTSISFQLQNKDLTYQEQYGSMLAAIHIFGRVTDSRGYLWEEFEVESKPEVPKPFVKEMLEGTSYCQEMLPLKTGSYRLELAVKDHYSGNVGTIYETILVPNQK